MNPIRPEDIRNRSELLLNPEYLITTSLSNDFEKVVSRLSHVDHDLRKRVDGDQDFRISRRLLADIELQAVFCYGDDRKYPDLHQEAVGHRRKLYTL